MEKSGDDSLRSILNEIDKQKSVSSDFVASSGIFDIDSDTYHSAGGVSKSGLWCLHTKTPFHYRFGERQQTKAFSLGDGAHAAVLEPDRFESDFICGPDDRRGSKWKDALFDAEGHGKTLLTSGDYDIARRVRDSAHANPTVRALTKECVVEKSGFAVDAETGVLVRCRPDIYNSALSLIGDLKTTTDAGSFAFSKSVSEYGYHMQEAMYSEVWQNAGGGVVDGFVFIAVEKTAPYPVAVYELERTAVAEGYEAYRSAVSLYSISHHMEAELSAVINRDKASGKPWAQDRIDHALKKCWPGYPANIQRMDIPKWGYKLTNRTEE